MKIRTGVASAASVLAIGLALTGCSGATGASSTTAADSGEVAGANAPASIQDQLKVIEVMLVSQQKAAESGLTEKSSGYIYSYDPATNHSIRYYPDSVGEPIVWEEGNQGSSLAQMMNLALFGVSDVVKTNESLTFTGTDPYGKSSYTITLELKDGVVVSMSQGDEFSSNKSVLDYTVTEEAKTAFAQSISSEEAYPQEEYVEEPLQ